MNLGNVLTIGSNALAAAAQGTQLASQNISNAATPGYTRRIASQEAVPLREGGGVRTGQSVRVTDAFLERRGLGARAFAGEASARASTLAILDDVLADGQGSVGDALAAFDRALSDLAVHPGERAAREAVLAAAAQLGTAMNRTADALGAARVDANTRVSAAVQDVNRKLTEIGALGAQIVAANHQGQEASDLIDKRDALVREVADALPVSTIAGPDGAITLLLAGSRTLVDASGEVHLLQANVEPTSGDVRIFRTTAGAAEDITSLVTSGSIGGTIAARDGALATARGALDALAYDIATAYNAQHSAGVGLDGVSGRNLFDPLAAPGGAAAALRLSSDVAGSPDALAAASTAVSLPGDNRNALALLGLRDQNIALAGTATAQQAFSALVAGAATSLRSARDQQEHADAALSQIESLREAVSGVSTDEEMVALMKFQRAYQASLRVIEAADAMLTDLLNLRR